MRIAQQQELALSLRQLCQGAPEVGFELRALVSRLLRSRIRQLLGRPGAAEDVRAGVGGYFIEPGAEMPAVRVGVHVPHAV